MSSQPSRSRRSFLRNASLAGAATALVGSPTLLAKSAQPAPGKAKNLIFLVADGMGVGTLSLAHHWSLRHQNRPLNYNQLYLRPDSVLALQDTASASSPVTDSAAAASAWGIGQRVNNGAINLTPSGATPLPILLHARNAGKRVGLVTTCRVTHATPAAFAANVASRNEEDAIAAQYLEREIDLILGGGFKHFHRPDSAKPGIDLLGRAADKGYRLARTADQLAQSPDEGPLLGLFHEDHIPYAIDRENDPQLAHIPSLETLFRKALANLSRSPRGFALQVEAGRIDHVGHANDPAAILRETLEFDRCIAIATEFQARHPDTLVIVTTDHGTGGCQLNGWGSNYADSANALDRINRFTASFEGLHHRFQSSGSFDPAAFAAATGLPATPDRFEALPDALAAHQGNYERALIELFAKDLLETTAVGWTSHNHTAENVELQAFGPGSAALPRFLLNADLHPLLTTALSLKV